MKRLTRVFRLFYIFIILISCKKEPSVIDQSTNQIATYKNVVLNKKTKEPEKLLNFSEVKVDSAQLVFAFKSSSNLPNYQPGDILIGNSGNGYLRKVESIFIQGNSIKISTANAALDEAFDKIKVDTSFIFSPDNKSLGQINYKETNLIKGQNFDFTVKSSNATLTTNEATGELNFLFPNMVFSIETPDRSGKFEIKAEKVNVSIKITLEKFVIDYDNSVHKQFSLVYKVDCIQEFTNVTMILKGGIEEQYPDLKHEDLIPQDIFLGTIPLGPVALTFDFNLAAGIKGKYFMGAGTNLVSSMTSTSSYLVGAEVINGVSTGVWEKSSTVNSSINFIPNESISGEARLFIKPKLKMKLYRTVGPTVFVTGFAYAEVKYPPISAEWGFGLDGGLSFDLNILSKQIAYFKWVLAEKKWPQWNYVNKPPDTPEIISPLNNSANQPTSPLLKWTCTDPDLDLLTYDIYFDKNSSPTTLFSTLQNSTNFQINGLDNSATYYWRVTANDNYGNTTSGPIWNFTTGAYVNTPPSVPSSPFPIDGATGQSSSPTLSWSCSDPDADALTYDMYFGTSSNPTTAVATNQSSTSINRSGLNAGTTYYWKIVAKDNKGASTTGPVWSFTTAPAANNPPSVPINLTPINGSTGQSLATWLTWDFCGDPDGDNIEYDVYFDTNSNPATLITTIVNNNSKRLTGLAVSTKYYWKIVARDNKGATSESSIMSFTTTSTANYPPSVPSSPSPSNGATGQSTSPPLGWTVSDTDGDDVYIAVFLSKTNPPTSVVFQNWGNPTSFSASGLNLGTTYYWKVIAKDIYSEEIRGPIWSFTTAFAANNPPSPPSNPNPSNGAMDVSTSPTLSWSCSDPDGDALTYDVYFGTSSSPTTLIAADQSATIISRSGLANSTTYYWKVLAKDSKNASTTSSIWSFTTAAAGGPLIIGQTYQGGIIFYLTGTYPNQHGLISAPTDAPGTTNIPWWNGNYVLTNAAGTAVGTGQSNTIKIVAVQGTGSYAAKICDDLVINGYSDWYLPSKDELNLLYLQKSIIPGITDYVYWSSSETNYNTAWAELFQIGNQTNLGYKDTGGSVRAIRSF